VSKRRQSKHRDVGLAELSAIVDRAKAAPLSADDCATLKATFETFAFLQQELKAKGASIERLRQIVFGSKTEKTSAVFGKSRPSTSPEGSEGKAASGAKKPGHGRNGAAAYQGANRVKVPHPALTAGEPCAECLKGKLYPLSEPAVLVRVTGMAPLGATVYECDRLRCNLCGEVFTAPAPDGVAKRSTTRRRRE